MDALRASRFFSVLALLCGLLASPAFSQSAPEKSSPFTAVRWDGEVPLVRFDGQWYGFEALDGLSRQAILAHAREAYGRRWQKRFSEDLVDVLVGMGHIPEVSVHLQLSRDGEAFDVVGRMSEENRRSVRDFNDAPDAGEARAASTARPSERTQTVVAGDESSAQHAWARGYAAHIDAIWDAPPQEGTANLNFLVQRDGAPMAGTIALQTEFTFQAVGRRGQQLSQGFNPNEKGRWVYEGLAPGTYDVTIRGLGRFEGWTWQQTVTGVAGEVIAFELALDR